VREQMDRQTLPRHSPGKALPQEAPGKEAGGAH
jgi:hypothetical protein